MMGFTEKYNRYNWGKMFALILIIGFCCLITGLRICLHNSLGVGLRLFKLLEHKL